MNIKKNLYSTLKQINKKDFAWFGAGNPNEVQLFTQQVIDNQKKRWENKKRK